MKKILTSTLLASVYLLLYQSVVMAAVPISVTFQMGSKTAQPVVGRPNLYDYEPSAFLDTDGKWKIWYCGQQAGTIDTTYLATLAPGGSDNNPKPVLNHACGPTTIKFGGKYLMYFENVLFHPFYDATKPSNPTLIDGGILGIGYAESPDGINWKVRDESGNLVTPAAPNTKSPIPENIVWYSPVWAKNCNISNHDGKDFMDPKCNSIALNFPIQYYGIGHPSAIVKNTNGRDQIWLWYYDSGAVQGYSGVTYLTKSYDGINFDSPVATNLTYKPVNVIYASIPVGSYPGYYLAITSVNNNNVYAWSVDGVTWNDSLSPSYPGQYRIGQASSQSSSGPNTIVTDPSGAISSNSVDIISAEGVRTPTAQYPWPPASWDLWHFKGTFNASLFCSDANKCLTRAEGARILADQFKIKSNPPASPTFADVPKDSPYFQAIETLWSNKITSGCFASPLIFCPGALMTRAEAVTFLLRTAKKDVNPEDKTPRFTDVPTSYPLFPYVQLFGSLGLTTGCSANPPKFCPDDPIRAADFDTFISRLKNNLASPGDLNGDGKVDKADFDLAISKFENPYTIWDINNIFTYGK